MSNVCRLNYNTNLVNQQICYNLTEKKGAGHGDRLTPMITVLTVNIQAYDTCENSGNCGELFQKITNLGADVICIQEDLENNTNNKLFGYILMGTCRAEEIYDTHLVNRIYVKNSIAHQITLIKSLDITAGCNVPRCDSRRTRRHRRRRVR